MLNVLFVFCIFLSAVTGSIFYFIGCEQTLRSHISSQTHAALCGDPDLELHGYCTIARGGE